MKSTRGLSRKTASRMTSLLALHAVGQLLLRKRGAGGGQTLTKQREAERVGGEIEKRETDLESSPRAQRLGRVPFSESEVRAR